jgi:hypothetical protein
LESYHFSSSVEQRNRIREQELERVGNKIEKGKSERRKATAGG